MLDRQFGDRRFQGSAFLGLIQTRFKQWLLLIQRFAGLCLTTVPPGQTGPAQSSSPPKPAVAKTYTVVSGDTLSKISNQVYGTKNRWKDILDANGDVLKSQKDLKPGQVLKIPQ